MEMPFDDRRWSDGWSADRVNRRILPLNVSRERVDDPFDGEKVFIICSSFDLDLSTSCGWSCLWSSARRMEWVGTGRI